MNNVVYKASTDEFFKILKYEKHTCTVGSLDNLCFSADQFAKVKDLFNQFLLKHGPFDWCKERRGYWDGGPQLIRYCRQENGPKAWLLFSTDFNSEKFSVSINDKAAIEAKTLEGITCWSDLKTNTPICQGSGSIASYRLQWKHRFNDKEDSDDGAVRWWRCKETAPGIARNCDDGLSLFGKVLQEAPKIPDAPPKPPETPESPASGFDSSYIKIGAGIAGIAAAILFACKSQSRNSKKDCKTEELPQSGLQTAKLSSTT